MDLSKEWLEAPKDVIVGRPRIDAEKERPEQAWKGPLYARKDFLHESGLFESAKCCIAGR